jgi:hypothetical protein
MNMNGCVGGDGARELKKGKKANGIPTLLKHVGIDSGIDTILSGSWSPRWYLVSIFWRSGSLNPISML